jgi:predicted small lipoprotein YifL
MQYSRSHPGLLLLLAALLALAGCGTPQAPEIEGPAALPEVTPTGAPAAADVEAAIAEFHELYNAQDFAALYDRAGGRFAKNSTQEEFVGFIEEIHATLGDVESSEILALSTFATNGAQETRVEVGTEFAEDSGTEEFTLRFTNSAWTWTRYNVTTPLLLSDPLQDEEGEDIQETPAAGDN